MMKIIIAILIVLVYVSPALAGDLGFDDFLPSDPLAALKDAGVYDIVLKVFWLITGLVVVAVLTGLIIGIGKASVHTAGNNSVGRTDAFAGMFYIVGAVVVMIVLGTIFFSVWNGLT